jgi:hypothetical protein
MTFLIIAKTLRRKSSEAIGFRLIQSPMSMTSQLFHGAIFQAFCDRN